MKKTAFYFLMCCVLLLIAACNKESDTSTENENNDTKLTVYTTVYPLTYFAERIGGEYINVSSIYPPGANEHHFEPTQKDMMNLAESDLFFYIGLNLEPFVDNAKESLAKEKVEFINTSEYVPQDQLHTSTHTHEDEHDHESEHNHGEEPSDEHGHVEEQNDEHDDHEHGNFDPHIWLSPSIAKSLALTIKDALVNKLPEQEQVFTENYNKLVEELDSLNNEWAEMAKNAKNKTFFVSHEAFGYITEEYGLEQVGIAGLNSQDEPSQKQLAELVDLGKELNIQYIFFEQNVSSNVATVIQNELGAQALTLHNLSVLTDEDIKNNEDYFTLMKKNIETLQKALN